MVTARPASRPSLRELAVEGPRSLGARTRGRRWDMFADLFPDVATMRVLDLGGTAESWYRAPVRPAEVVVVNLTEPGASDDDWLRPVTGDACDAATVLRGAGVTADFDLVFSNSLLEHVGGHGPRTALAQQVDDLAPRHWVQTPYRYFPIEPHWLFPGLQFLPMAARARVAHRWPLQHTRPTTLANALLELQWTELVGRRELQSYFPDSRIVAEKVAGLVKSLVAVRVA